MNNKIKIITLGDIFRNIETEEKAFKFKNYITNLQENYEKIYNENCKLRKQHNINDISLLDENHNLQEENERLKIEKQEEYNRFNLMSKFRDRALERELIYKSRNEKAIEVLERHTRYSTGELLSILQGENNDI